MRLHALPFAMLALLLLAHCTPATPAGRPLTDAQVLTSPNPWPTPLKLPSSAPPRILAVWMNETTIPNGSNWIGRVITSTNTASLEVRTESFSFGAHRSTFGDFSFRQHLLDMVPQYRRGYTLLIIARNPAGTEDRVIVPINFK